MKRFLAYLVLVLAGAGAGAGYAAYSANATATAAGTRTQTTTPAAPSAATQAGPALVQGQVTAKDATSLTIKTASGEQKFAVSDQTRVNVSKPASSDALKPEVSVLVTGATSESGVFEATSISIQPAGTAAFGGPQGGAAGGQNGRAATGTATAGGTTGQGNAPTRGGSPAAGGAGGNAPAGGARGGNFTPGGAAGGARASFLAGTITAVDGQNITLRGPQGDEKFHIAANTKIMTQEPGTLDSIAAGANVSVTEAGQGGANPRAVLVTVEAA